jgi:hypothetical protein
MVVVVVVVKVAARRSPSASALTIRAFFRYL